MKRLTTALLFLSLLAPGLPVASAAEAPEQDEATTGEELMDEAPTGEELMDEDGKIVGRDKEPAAQSSKEGP